MKPKTSHWQDSSNGWLCYACKRDSSSAYKICPNCGRKMRNGYVATNLLGKYVKQAQEKYK